MQQASVVAATTLALIMLVATFGTIWQADSRAVHCATAPCPAETQAGMAPSPTPWETSLRQALRQAERGLLQMAGRAPVR